MERATSPPYDNVLNSTLNILEAIVEQPQHGFPSTAEWASAPATRPAAHPRTNTADATTTSHRRPEGGHDGPPIHREDQGAGHCTAASAKTSASSGSTSTASTATGYATATGSSQSLCSCSRKILERSELEVEDVHIEWTAEGYVQGSVLVIHPSQLRLVAD